MIRLAARSAVASRTLGLAVHHLLAGQHADGWWKGELETNVTIEAEDLFLRWFLRNLTDRELAPTARWIRHRQRPDGSWGTFHGGPADLSTTVEAYVALRLSGDSPDLPHMRAARLTVLASGGVEAARVFTKMWLSLLGLWDWRQVPELPPELILLPAWAPLNIYDFACWARQTIVPLTIVSAARPVRPVGFGLADLRAGGRPTAAPADAWEWLFTVLDGALRRYRNHALRGLRRTALERAERWVLERQEADGSWGGIQPPWVYSLIALRVRGHANDHPAIRRGLQGLDGFTVREHGFRRIEACQSPVWDTALAATALLDAGLPGDHPALAAAGEWLAGQEITVAGDWAVRRPRLAPSGWAFEFANRTYPDIDDSAVVALALHRLSADGRRPHLHPAVERGAAWVAGMRSSSGGWAAFDADNIRGLCRRPPFCDFGEVIDPPSDDVTAHVIELLAPLGGRRPMVAGGVRWLLGRQQPDGSWPGRWGSNHIYGSAAVLPALRAAGLPRSHPAVVRAAAFLRRCQAGDGGWGEDMRSYRDPSWRGRGTSTASQTGWALIGLHAAGGEAEQVDAGLRWLAERVGPDGTWDEPEYTGTGFPGDFYINYHLYRQVYPTMALGRWNASAA